MDDIAGGVDEDVDDDHARGGWSPSEPIPALFPPSDLRWWPPADSLFMCFRSPPSCVLRSRREPFLYRILGQYEKDVGEIDDIRATR
jgi:hypothetical protein